MAYKLYYSITEYYFPICMLNVLAQWYKAFKHTFIYIYTAISGTNLIFPTFCFVFYFISFIHINECLIVFINHITVTCISRISLSIIFRI